jgi:hypothetical protein
LKKEVKQLNINTVLELFCKIILLELTFSFRFAILVSGFRSRVSPHAHFYEKKQKIATLHIIGETDRIVEKGK